MNTVSGPKMTANAASTFDTSASDSRRRQVRVENAGDAILEDDRFVGEPHELVVDVAEPVGHLLVDQVELAPRQAADDVALRNRRRAASTRCRA